MRRSRRASLLALLLAAALGPIDAAAQEVSTGLNVERFVPGIGPGALLGVDGAGAPAPTASFAASIDYARGLFTIRNRFSDAGVSTPVRSLVALDLAGEATLWRGLSIGLGLPVALSLDGDRLAGLGAGDESPLRGPVMGDLRVRLRYHVGSLAVGGKREGTADLALLLVGTLPLGGESQLFGTSGPTVEPRLLLGASWRWLRGVALLGYRAQPAQHLYGDTWDHGVHLAAGADLHVPRRGWSRLHLLVEGELDTLGPHPAFELRGGLRLEALPWLAVDVGGGGSTGTLPGEPSYRLFTVLRAGL